MRMSDTSGTLWFAVLWSAATVMLAMDAGAVPGAVGVPLGAPPSVPALVMPWVVPAGNAGMTTR